jgi:H+/Cl- antiporter ClcA
MIKNWKWSFDQFKILTYSLRWFLLVLPVAIVVGSIVAFFLWLLELATHIRWEHPYLLYFLPFVGVIIVWAYRFKGKNSEAGNNLVMDEIHKPGGGIPTRMASFVLFGTVLTHLFGGSAGREGTAVQIGGSMAQFIGNKFRLKSDDMRILLMAGVAAGFGAVFGTPLAGTIFALEVLTIGRIKYDALLPCFMASLLADMVCSLWGITHTHYIVSFQDKGSFSFMHFDIKLVAYAIVAGVLFGLCAYLFAESSHFIKRIAHKYIANKYLIPFLGGCVIIALTFVFGTDYLGLGVTTPTGTGACIVNAFHAGGVDWFSWLWKLIFTVITLSTGFKGGEVTPLFFIGAALGNTLAVVTGAPVDLFAAMGFIAVFAGATNTPLACTVMGVELFGGQHVLYFAIACFVAYYFSGHSGIYTSQKINVSKGNLDDHLTEDNTIGSINKKRYRFGR